MTLRRGPTTFREAFNRGSLYIPALVLNLGTLGFVDMAFRVLYGFSAKDWCDLTVVYNTHTEERVIRIGFVVRNRMAHGMMGAGSTGSHGQTGMSEPVGYAPIMGYGVTGFQGVQPIGTTGISPVNNNFGNGPFVSPGWFVEGDENGN